MPIDRWMGREDVHVYNTILINHQKEWNKVMDACCINMNGPRKCHTEWSKSDREGKISYGIPYMWNLKQNDTNELAFKTERNPHS